MKDKCPICYKDIDDAGYVVGVDVPFHVECIVERILRRMNSDRIPTIHANAGAATGGATAPQDGNE